MNSEAVLLARVLSAVNRETGRKFEYAGTFGMGFTDAHQIHDGADDVVLKLSQQRITGEPTTNGSSPTLRLHEGRVGGPATLQPTLEELHRRGALVPRIIDWGKVDGLIWTIQERLPGKAIKRVDAGCVDLVFNTVQKQSGIACGGLDFNEFLMDMLYGDAARGYRTAMLEASWFTNGLWQAIEEIRPRIDGVKLLDDGVVHGDMSGRQILKDGLKPSGIVDWDIAGHGDPVIDLACFAAELYSSPDPEERSLADRVAQRAVNMRGSQTLIAGMLYKRMASTTFAIENTRDEMADSIQSTMGTLLAIPRVTRMQPISSNGAVRVLS